MVTVRYIGALAADFDGTLTHDGLRPASEVLDGLRRLRDTGCLVLLVTGRIIDELEADFPDVRDHVDAIVAENGCVLWTSEGHRLLASPVDPQLAAALSDRGVSVRSGEVILAGKADDRVAALDEIRRFELDCQLVFNRTEMMILPSGLTKGTGLFEALGDMGVSRHSTVGVGDAENDRALLDVCEVGVAVANAVESLKGFADVVLASSGRGGAGAVGESPSGGYPRRALPAVAAEAGDHGRWRERIGSEFPDEPADLRASRHR